MKVLVADDNLMFRKLIGRYLEKYPEVVVVGEALDADGAIRKSKEFAPDIVILDVNMPGQGETTACAAIKEASPRTRVYVCSAHSDRVLKEIAIAANADGSIRKSTLSSDLAKIIRLELQKS